MSALEPAPLAPRRILLVEDEPSLVVTLVDRLAGEGYQVESARTGERGLARAQGGSFDLILLDVMPILMLTARGQVVDRVVGLKLGADDYLAKPFEMVELLARIEALFRRARAPLAGAAGTYAFGDVRVDFRRGEVYRGGKVVPLSALEFKLLAFLIQNRGALLTRNELLDKVWGYQSTPATRTVDVHVAGLRQKLERRPSRPEYILTVHRRGYRFAG